MKGTRFAQAVYLFRLFCGPTASGTIRTERNRGISPRGRGLLVLPRNSWLTQNGSLGSQRPVGNPGAPCRSSSARLARCYVGKRPSKWHSASFLVVFEGKPNHSGGSLSLTYALSASIFVAREDDRNLGSRAGIDLPSLQSWTLTRGMVRLPSWRIPPEAMLLPTWVCIFCVKPLSMMMKVPPYVRFGHRDVPSLPTSGASPENRAQDGIEKAVWRLEQGTQSVGDSLRRVAEEQGFCG